MKHESDVEQQCERSWRRGMTPDLIIESQKKQRNMTDTAKFQIPWIKRFKLN